MKEVGIVRKPDSLGRITLPVEIRKQINLDESATVANTRVRKYLLEYIFNYQIKCYNLFKQLIACRSVIRCCNKGSARSPAR
jgi:hypothetical protein